MIADIPLIDTDGDVFSNGATVLRTFAQQQPIGQLDRGDQPEVVLCHPDFVELLFSEHANFRRHMLGAQAVATKSVGSVHGEQWRAQRSVQTPHFAPDNITVYEPVLEEMAHRFARNLPTDQSIVIHDRFQRLAVEMILRTVAGVSNVPEDILDRAAVLTKWQEAMSNSGAPPASLEKAHDELISELRTLIESEFEAIRRGVHSRGLVPDLLAAGPESKANYTDERVIDEVLAKLFSAHRTTSQTWTATLACLSYHYGPRIEPTEWTGGIRTAVDEALRLHCPVTSISRRTTEPIEIEGQVIPANSILHFPPPVYHLDERWWEKPDNFDPERFAREEPSHPRAFLPFGAGPRRCLGETFALAQARSVISAIIDRYQLQVVGNMPETHDKSLQAVQVQFSVPSSQD